MRRLLTLFACLLIAGMALADRVSEREALKKAQAFMPGERFELQKYSSSAGGQNVENPFYIFNVENGGGYVIVSGNDQTTAILGYSTNGNIDMNNIPDNLRYWLESYAEQLRAIDDGTPVATSRARTRGARENIEPLLTTTWDQGRPYNLMCPDSKGRDYTASGYDQDKRCVTGCVATAVAQIMYYHQWPKQTSKAVPSYSATINGYSFSPGGLPVTIFEWEKMKDSYDYEETGEEAWAVAKLMRYVGQAFYMGYNIADNGGSAASIHEDAMMDIFNYSKNMHSRSRNAYTTTQWENMVYDELANKRPVPYSGRSDRGGGHQFVCDGYKDGLFHINWGWSGSSDGFYILSIADPDGKQGIGGSTGAYKNYQSADFYFIPASPDEEEIPILSSDIDGRNPSEYTRSSASEDFTGISLSGKYYPLYYYYPTTTYQAEVGWGLYQDEDLIGCVGYSTTNIDNRDVQPYYYYTCYNNLSDLSFGADLPNGKYQLRQIFRKAGSNDEWMLMDNYGISYLVAEISGNALTVKYADTISESFQVNSLSISEEPAVGMDVDVTINITNTSDAIKETVCLWTAPQGSSSWTKVAEQTAYFDPGKSGDVNLKFQPTASGTYTLKVTTAASDEALATQDYTVADVVQVTIDDIVYTCIPAYGKAIIKSGSDNTKASLTIPATITASGTEYRVTGIGEQAFRSWNNISTLVIPEGIESIGKDAFIYCSSLRMLVLPATLKSIETGAFYRTSSLKEVVSYIQTPFVISDDTFIDFDFDLEKRTPSKATLYVPVGTKNDYQALSGWTQFKAIEEGEVKITTIDGLNYSYSTVSRQATLITGDYVNMTSANIHATFTVDDVEYEVKTIAAKAFYYCKSLEDVSVPDGIEIIEERAFQGDYKMNEFAIPSHLKYLGEYALFNCNRFKTIILPEGLESIGSNAFSACYGLQKLVLPSTLSSIGQNVIQGCRSITTVVSHIKEPFMISNETFAYETKQDENTLQNNYTLSPATLYVPVGTKDAYQAITGWTMFTAIREGEIKEGIVNGLNYSYDTGSKKATVIAGNYGELTDLVIPAKVTIDDVEYSVEAIGAEAFSRSANLGTVSLPDGLKTIGDDAFYNCYRLVKITLPKKLESIGEYAFAYCFWLKEIELPSSLKSIGKRAFYGNKNFEKVISRIQDPFEIDESTFKNEVLSSPATLYVPASTKSKYEAITGWTVFQGGIEEMERVDGDLDGDGVLSAGDVMAILSYLLGEIPDGFDETAADFNGDGMVTITDALLLMEMIQ